MKRVFDWQVTLGVILIALTTLVYFVHYLVFRDIEHIFIYFIGDVAFVFFEVLLVTLVIHRLLHHREQRALRNKLNMLIGAFFSELGTDLLRRLTGHDQESHRLAQHLLSPSDWSERQFLNIQESAREHNSAMDSRQGDLEALRDHLQEKKQFMLDLLQNPSLLENEPFTNLVWAVFHLTEELAHRRDLKDLPEADHRHLAEDMERVYHLLLVQWTGYMMHLKKDYPYLFSLAKRTNPLTHHAPVEVK